MTWHRLLCLFYLACTLTVRGEQPDTIVVRLVTDHASDALVSDRERMEPIVETYFGPGGTKTVPVGTRAVLWVRNASVDGKFTFEQFYKGEYIRRSGELRIPIGELGAGEHRIGPGDHRFSLNEDGSLSSKDPEIQVRDNTVALRLHKIGILGVNAAKAGPAESRLVPTSGLGLFALAPDATISPEALPDPKDTEQLRNAVSHPNEKFYPLSIYLPSNQVGQGYVLYPTWQAFQVTPKGRVALGAGGAPTVPGVQADGASIRIPFRQFEGRLNSKTGLQAAVGTQRLGGRSQLDFGPTLAPVKFTAGLGEPDPEFYLPVSADLSDHPHKFFLADNTTKDPEAVRALVLEWNHPVFTRAAKSTLRLRFLETPGKATLAQPEARMAWSPYRQQAPRSRSWRPVSGVAWVNEQARGELTFDVPDLPFGFVALRVTVMDRGSSHTDSPLKAELLACIVEKDQQGTASFISNKGRNAFVAGEDLRLAVAIRSQSERPAGQRTIELRHPDGRTESFAFPDAGGTWCARPFQFAAEVTRRLLPGRYELRVTGLPVNITCWPFAFDVASAQPRSLFKIVKPSKYTGPMNGLVGSYSRGRGDSVPYDLDRAVASLAELGYNRIDHMTYSTYLHGRFFTFQEELASVDARLMAPGSVYNPSPRNQLLNACVRHGIEFSDVLLSYNDFHLPRYIDGYIEASKRWVRREMLAMRHSPALAGMMLYDEMYENAASAFPDAQPHQFKRIRLERAERELGQTEAKISSAFSRYVSRPRRQRDPEALKEFLRLRRYQKHGWGDYNTQVADAAREIVPGARIGTYHRYLLGFQSSHVEFGYLPDLGKDLDLLSTVHYSDNSTGWVHICMNADLLRFKPRREVFINMPLTWEHRSHQDGQYQRHMAFAMLQQGADGVSFYGLAHDFRDGPNLGMMAGKETTKHLNREILAPFGELVRRATRGYRGVAIVLTQNQYLLGPYKDLDLTNQAESLWVACWRLGYAPRFVYADVAPEELRQYDCIFVPGVRFDGELSETIREELGKAAQAGAKVVVEAESVLDLPGLIRLQRLQSMMAEYYLGVYFPTWTDDEVLKVFERSQPLTDYLRSKLPELGIEPAARGPFKVGPTWWSSDDLHYLVMANFDDPEYNHAVKQVMAKPVLMPLTISARRGRVAYDLLHQEALPLKPVTEGEGGEQWSLTLDMTRIQGGLVACLPEPVGKLRVEHAMRSDRSGVRLTASLVGESGKLLKGVFPARIRLSRAEGDVVSEYFRALGGDRHFDLDLPGRETESAFLVEVREGITGQTARLDLEAPALAGAALTLAENTPLIPYPAEVRGFLADNRSVKVLVDRRQPELHKAAKELADALRQRGMEAAVEDEMTAYRFPTGDPDAIDPMNDGFHSWRKGYELIQPATVVDAPVILLGGRGRSYLLDGLAGNGFLTVEPMGSPGTPMRPTIQLARRGLHWKYDALCLTADSAADMRQAVASLLAEIPAPPKPAPPEHVPPSVAESTGTSPAAAPQAFTGNNEQIVDMQADKAGNLYLITWGHGNNLYSLDPDGKLRFTRYLPEMGARGLQLYDDRLLVYTAAGARLYQLALDGKPISQVRLNMDPGIQLGEGGPDDDYALSSAQYEYLPERDQILHWSPLLSAMRLINSDGSVAVQWEGEPYTDKDVSDKVLRRDLRSQAFSPDRTRIAQVETSMYYHRIAHQDEAVYDSHLVIRDLNGKLLHEYQNLANTGSYGAHLTANLFGRVRWRAGDPGPSVAVKGEVWQFDETLKLLHTRGYETGVFDLGTRGRLVADGRALRLINETERELARFGPFETFPSLAAISPDGAKLAFLDEYGKLSICGADTGEQLAAATVDELGHVLRFTPDSRRVLVGGLRGGVSCFTLDGKPAWKTSLGQYNSNLGKALALYDPAFRDLTPTLWPGKVDQPGDLDELVRLGANQLANGDCEQDAAWQGDAVRYHGQGYQGKRSLRVGREVVSQKITEYLGKHVTWVLEFLYKAAPDAQPAVLIAGLKIDCRYPDSVGRQFPADGQWRFARMVAKSGADAKALTVGFMAGSGEALVDRVSLRQIRFPSINHLRYEPLYDVEPLVITNPFYAATYMPVGNIKQDMPNRILVEGLGPNAGPETMFLEPAFLQNSRINDVGSTWYIQPKPGPTPITAGFRQPQWVSMVALYFDAAQPENVAPHFDVFCTDMETRKQRRMASVRHNRQVFRLVKFPPVRTAEVRIELVNPIRRLRTLTEVELYGPLSGKEGAPGFADPEGQNTYMGSFARVDPRPKTLPRPGVLSGHGPRETETFELWALPYGQILASENRLYVSRTLGVSESYDLESLKAPHGRARAGALGFSPYLTLYGGLLLKPGQDGKLYCVSPDTGGELWSIQLGERLVGAPVAVESDVFAASDTGFLSKIDLANGSVMMRKKLSGGVYGSLALDGGRLFFITEDGKLWCVSARDGAPVWSVPVAPDTEATPAVDAGTVYCADQQGLARAVAAKDGKVLWTTPLGEEFARCPVVLKDRILFGCSRGKLAALNRSDGKLIWTAQAGAEFEYEPVVCGDTVLYFAAEPNPAGGPGSMTYTAMLANLPDGATTPLLNDVRVRKGNEWVIEQSPLRIGGDPIAPISYYQGCLFIVPRHGDMGHTMRYTNDLWHYLGGSFHMLALKPEPKEKK